MTQVSNSTMNLQNLQLLSPKCCARTMQLAVIELVNKLFNACAD